MTSIISKVHKEDIYTLLGLLSKHLERIDRQSWKDKTTEEVLGLMYMQGVAEALDAFDVQELLRSL